MIFLDTNYLIRGLAKDTPESVNLTKWCRDSVDLLTNSLVWCEFITGPITQVEIDLDKPLLPPLTLLISCHSASMGLPWPIPILDTCALIPENG